MGRRLKRLGIGVVGLVALGAVLVGVGELLLRTFPQYLPEEAHLRIHWREIGAGHEPVEPHEEVGFVHAPNSTEVQRGIDGFGFTYTTDEHGFRNPSPWPESADIVVLGDSQAFGYGVDDEETWYRRLDDMLPESRVINLGLISSAPQQHVRAFEAFGAPLQPDVVVVMLYPAHALGAAVTYDEWIEAGRPVAYDEWRRGGHREPGPLQTVKNAIKESWVVMAGIAAWKELNSPLSGVTMALPDDGTVRLAPTFYEGLESGLGPGSRAFDLVVESIEATRRLAMAQGAKTLVVLVPTKETVHLPLAGAPAPDLVAPFAAHFDEAGVPHLDLTTALRARAERGERLFFTVDVHPNPKGYDLIARTILRHLTTKVERYGINPPS